VSDGAESSPGMQAGTHREQGRQAVASVFLDKQLLWSKSLGNSYDFC